MVSFMTLCAEEFRKHHSSAVFSIEGRGNATAALRLTSGEAMLGVSTRPFTASERERFTQSGRELLELPLYFDMLAVIVNNDNPLDSITLPQLDAIFSSTRKRGYREDIRTWGQAGLRGEWADRPIHLVGRNSASAGYGFFKRVALDGGDYKNEMREWGRGLSSLPAVIDDPSAISFGSAHVDHPGIKILSLARADGGPPVRPNVETLHNGAYPLVWASFIAVVVGGDQAVDPLLLEFFRFVYSKQGQGLVVKDGHYPVIAAIAKEQLKKLGIKPRDVESHRIPKKKAARGRGQSPGTSCIQAGWNDITLTAPQTSLAPIRAAAR